LNNETQSAVSLPFRLLAFFYVFTFPKKTLKWGCMLPFEDGSQGVRKLV
jgi:hypothetical protein